MKTINLIKVVKNILLSLKPYNLYVYIKRQSIEKKLNNLFLKFNKNNYFEGTVLVDGTFDNPNYWFRYTLLKSALNFSDCSQKGIIGKYNKSKVRKTFKNFGVKNFYNFYSLVDNKKINKKSRELYNFLRKEKKIDKLKLPYDFPKEIFYDGLLRRQRLGTVNYSHKDLELHIKEFLICLENARQLIQNSKPKLLVLSHAVNFDCGSLAWFALKYNISTVVIYGEYGSLRFWKPSKSNKLFMCGNFISLEEIKKLNKSKQIELEKVGENYLTKRLSAQVKDIGAKTAFNNMKKVTRKDICKKFNWDYKKKIIAIYSVSWIDFPHLHGKNLFVDSGKWMETTLKTIFKNKNINWIIKRHPLEKHYSSENIDDFFQKKIPKNIKFYPENWGGNSLLSNIDGLVTFNGTAAIEAASLNKIVLTGTKGWYGDCEFVLYPKTKEEYINLLNSDWNINKSKLALFSRRAKQFACWHFCVPKWQSNYILNDDFDNEKNYFRINELINNNQCEIKKEVDLIKKWYKSNFLGYHSFKMSDSNKYNLSNIV